MRIGLTPDSRWDVDLPGLIDAASGAGFTSLGISGAAAGAEALAAYRGAGLCCDEVLALMVSANEEKTLASAATLAESASAMDAAWVLAVFGVVPSPDLVARCAAAIAEGGARLAVEFSPLGPVGGIGPGLEIVAAAGPGRAGLMIDSWHFSHGPSTWAELEQVPLPDIAYVQFTDALAPVAEVGFEECMNRRAVPGEGVLELERFASTLRGRGWDGLVSAEVLSEDLRRLAPADAAQRIYDATAAYWL